MKVIVYEHISSGGCAGQHISPNILSEGFGMLRSVVKDFKSAGHETTVLLDARLSKLNPPLSVDCMVPILYPKEAEKFLINIAKINDAVYIIAPETEKTLQSLTYLVEEAGKNSLNCKSEAIGMVTDKMGLDHKLKKNRFSTPKTLFLNITDSLSHVKHSIKQELNYPVIFKPVEGVGCSGLSIVKEAAQVEKAINKIKFVSKSTGFLVQEFINGISASVSLISNGKKATALSLNKQNINLSGPDGFSSYKGGIAPFSYWLKQDVFNIAEKVIEEFSGLTGYVGVDFVLTEHKAFIVDVNPRLTTSYVGLHKVARFNVAEALVNAVLRGKLPSKPESRSVACFSKIRTPLPSVATFQKIVQVDSVVSPPFLLNDTAESCALVIGDGENLDEAKLRLEEAKKHLLDIFT